VGRAIPDAALASVPFGGDGWRLTADGAAVTLPHVPSVFALGNGFVGMRGPGGGPEDAKIYLNGVYEIMPIAYHEAAHGYARESDSRLAVADATQVRVTLDGNALPAPAALSLDMAQGMLTSRHEVAGTIVEIDRLVSMTRPGVVATRVRIAADGAHRLEVRPVVSPPPASTADTGSDAVYDPRVGPGFGASPWEETATIDTPMAIGRVDRLRRSGFAVAALAAGGGDAVASGSGCVAAYAACQGPDSSGSALSAAQAALEAAREAGFDRLATEQAEWFAGYWQDAQVDFDAAPRATQALRHALFQLVQAVGRDGTTSIGAKGQTGEGYEGHVFWDADSYVLPALVFLRPEIARAMLRWRIARLEPARHNARAMGHERGALYPWRTIAGAECSSFFPAGSAQYHINADIAHALQLYVDATGDRTILTEGGAEMLAETARIWLEIGYHDPARGNAFVINRVTGPDEYSAIVDNNLYTNMMAAAHLRFAAAVARQPGFEALLTPEEVAAMERAAEAMLLPRDPARDIYAQDEGFFGKQAWPFATTPAEQYPLLMHFHPLTIYRHQVSKQADAILATTVLRDSFDPDMRARMLDAYEAVTVHDSTLSASAFATAAAGIGDAPRAAAYWQVSALTDLCDLFGNSDHGLHMAALAGSWTALAMGFAGMRADDGGLSFAPIAVPVLGPYRFRLHFHGRRIDVSVSLEAAEYSLVSGDALTLSERGIPFRLLPGQPVTRELAA